MAILETDTPIRKRAGNVVFYVRSGNQIVRSLPSHYRDAKTERQLYNREKLKVLSAFFSPLNSYLCKINNRTDAFNYIEGLNYDICIAGSFPGLYIDLEKVVLSKGNLEPLDDLEAEVVDGECFLSWNYGGSIEDRMVCVCCVDSATHAFSIFENVPVGQYSFTIENFEYEEAIVYATVVAGEENSTSTLCKSVKKTPTS